MSWEKVNISEVSEQIRGVSYKPSDLSNKVTENHVPVLRANNVTENGIKLNDLVYVNKKRISKNQVLKAGDILIVASSGSKTIVGRAISIEKDMDASFGAFCKIVRPNIKVDKGYLGFYFRSAEYRRIISHLSAGANINNLRSDDINTLQIPVPPLHIQKQIANILDKADALRKKDQQLLQKYDELAESIFIDMFGDPVKNEKGWEVKSLEEIILDGPQNGLYKNAKDYGSGFPILRIDSFYHGVVYNLSKLKRVNVNDKELKMFQIYEDNIVINRVNSRSHLGKCALIPKLNEPTLFESNMMRFEVDKQKVNPKFLVQMLIQPFMKNQILKRAKDAVNQSSINQQDIKSFKLPLPPINLQEQFVNILNNIQHQSFLLKNSLREGEHTFQSLLQKAFTGELIRE